MIAKIEKGQIDLPQSKIMAFAKALETDARILMGDDGIVTDKQPTYNVFVSTNEKISWTYIATLTTKASTQWIQLLVWNWIGLNIKSRLRKELDYE